MICRGILKLKEEIRKLNSFNYLKNNALLMENLEFSKKLKRKKKKFQRQDPKIFSKSISIYKRLINTQTMMCRINGL
jgi:hypothetical protein